MKVRFISDLHLGHNKICEFTGDKRGGCTTVEEHDKWLIEQWNSVVEKRDLVWVLGDVAFTKEGLHKLKKMKGNKHMVWGNHDKWSHDVYKLYFNKVRGFTKYKGLWLSHSPIHPQELRGKPNVHGHVHANSVPHGSYFNVCVEALNGKPITIEEIKEAISG